MSLLQQNMRRKISLGQDGNSLVLLIIFNVLVYILLNFVKLVYIFNSSTAGVFEAQVLSMFSIPAQPAVFATRPWTLLLYMFTHYDVWELVSSMLWLGAFGYILQNLSGNKKLIPIYIYGGIAGSVFFLLAANLIPPIRQNVNSVFPMLGAGPALMAIAVATTSLAPNYRVLPMLKIPLWVLTAIFIIIRVGTVGSGNLAHVVALIAGGLMGSLFVWQLQKGNDWGQWMSDAINWTDNLFNPEKKNVKPPPKKQLFYKASQKPYAKTPHVTQQRVDELLDKINMKGYNSLSEDEKAFLKKASREEL